MFPAGVSVLFLTFAIHLQDTWTDSAKDFTTQFWTIKTDLPADQAHDAGADVQSTFLQLPQAGLPSGMSVPVSNGQ